MLYITPFIHSISVSLYAVHHTIHSLSLCQLCVNEVVKVTHTHTYHNTYYFRHVVHKDMTLYCTVALCVYTLCYSGAYIAEQRPPFGGPIHSYMYTSPHTHFTALCIYTHDGKGKKQELKISSQIRPKKYYTVHLAGTPTNLVKCFSKRDAFKLVMVCIKHLPRQ